MKVEASILLPSNTITGAAIYHATDIKFYEAPEGKNVLCMTDDVDLQRTYKTTFGKSEHIVTHMQACVTHTCTIHIKIRTGCDAYSIRFRIFPENEI